MIALLGLIVGSASADFVVQGDRIRVHYNSHGTWNSSSYGRGFEVRPDDLAPDGWTDISWQGTAWQHIQMEWDQGVRATSTTEITMVEATGPPSMAWRTPSYRG